MYRIDKALLFAQLDRMIMLLDQEDDKQNLIDELRRELKKLASFVEDYAV